MWLQQMQALTPEQWKFVSDLGWKGAEAVVWAAAGLGGRAIWNQVTAIRPGIIAEINGHTDAKLKEHSDADAIQFSEVKRVATEDREQLKAGQVALGTQLEAIKHQIEGKFGHRHPASGD
jgi:hypothetical protein